MRNDNVARAGGVLEFDVIAFTACPYPTLLFQTPNEALTVHEFMYSLLVFFRGFGIGDSSIQARYSLAIFGAEAVEIKGDGVDVGLNLLQFDFEGVGVPVT
jgi:hypothetical protein